MRTAILINEILEGIERLVQNIRKFLTGIKSHFKKPKTNITILYR